MKKYRVITYNLDWAGIPINSVVEELGDCMYAVYTGLSLPISIGNKEIHQALLIRGEWFEEIKEEVPVESKAYSLECAYLDKVTMPLKEVLDIVEKTKIKCKSISDAYERELKKNHYSLEDMIDFGRFVYDQAKPSTIPIDMILLDKWIQKAYPEDCVTKKE